MRKEFYFPSKDGDTQIHAIEWFPEGEVVGVLQIVHGMAEHIERYDAFASYIASKGFYVVGHSHLGHGKSVTTDENLGYFHSPNGNECVLGDIDTLRRKTEEQFQNVPYFILGHSMGSFLVRQYVGIYGEGLSGAIVMGTGDQPKIAVVAGKMICKLFAAFKGWKYRSNIVNALIIGSYERKYGKAWLSKNQDNVIQYEKDPLCGFVFTLNAFYHMLDGIGKMNAAEKAGKMPKTLPVFFVAGSEDPVGACGVGVKQVYQRYVEMGVKQVRLKLYEGNRHEILNEFDRENVYQDIWEWIDANRK